MEVIQYLLRFLFKLAVVAFFVALVWWLVATIAPEFSFRSLFSMKTATSTYAGGWLPSPRGGIRGFINQQASSSNNYTYEPYVPADNLYVPGEPYKYVDTYKGIQSGPQATFVTYSPSGVQIVNSVGTQGQQVSTSNGYSQKELFIRNLSIYEKGHVYTGLAFEGEARNSLFQNGKFPIIIADQSGRAVYVTYGEAVTNSSVPGWVKFKVKISGVLPNKVPCTMVFEQARAQNSQASVVRVAIPVMCN